MSQRAIADDLTMMANAMAQEATNRNAERVSQENLRGNENEARLERFLKNNPQVFKGGHDPDVAIKWLEAMERIFGAMRCSETQKVTLGTYMLHEDASYWRRNASQRLRFGNTVITWESFKREFLVKYFPSDIRNRKVVEFMELKQGNISVADYAAKFEELCRYSPHYNTVEEEMDNCLCDVVTHPFCFDPTMCNRRISGLQHMSSCIFVKFVGFPLGTASCSLIGFPLGTVNFFYQNVANFDMDAIAALISAPTTDANSEFHSLTSTHAPNDNEMMNNDDINEDMQDFEDEE
ncbi:hypothetical protein QL285_031409 [Trifolium repens]|nr:hypothetical protein QL285_031409 [Trifolium repens]